MKFLIILGLLCLIPVGAYAIPPDGTGIPPTHAFAKIIVDGLTELTSKKYNDSLNIESGTNITIDANTTTNTITINSSGGGATQLNDLTDVIISSPLTNEILIYNGSEWINDSNPGAASQLNDLTDVNAVGCSDEQVLEYDTGTSKWICGTDDVGTGGSFDKTNIAYINQTNTYVPGEKQTISHNSTTAGFNLGNVGGNPSSVFAGDVWFDGTNDKILFYDGIRTRELLDTHGHFNLDSGGQIVFTHTGSISTLNLDSVGGDVSFPTTGDVYFDNTDNKISYYDGATLQNIVTEVLSQTLTNKDISSTTNTYGSIHQLSNVTSTGCAVGQILKVSGASWVCAADDTGGGGGGSTLGFSGASATVLKGATSYLGWGSGGVQSAEANAEIKIGHAATISNLYCYVIDNSSGADGNTITVRHNGAGTTLQVTFDTGVTGWQSDLTGSYSVSAGDTLSIEVINTGSGGGTKNLTVGSCSVDMS